VALGVTSSIAAYKAAELTSALVQHKFDVRVIMTENATKLVCPQTFSTLSQNQTITDLWSVPDWRPEHIALADEAELLVIAPATANFIAKMANGIADDALSTYAVSHEGPVIVAPAMNPRMWRNPVVQENCRKLRHRGIRIIDPEQGRVACGEDTEPGRMANPERIKNAVIANLTVKAKGRSEKESRKILISAGPTREMLDDVRFITNHSSGKMGYALAEAAQAVGFETVLVSGPVSLPPPSGGKLVKTVTGSEMKQAVMDEFPACDALVMSAAVTDFRPTNVFRGKLKKGQRDSFQLELEVTEDILSAVASAKKQNQKIMGFAAETGDVIANAQAKLKSKHLDWIVANDVSQTGIGFGSDENKVTLISPNGQQELERMPKYELAAILLEKLYPQQSQD